MQTLDDVARLALALPEVTEGVDKFRKTSRTWEVGGKAFAWERPFSKADIKRFGDATPPAGTIVAIRTADLHEKEAILAADPGAFFTIPHFDGYDAYLVQLDNVTAEALREALVDGWLAVAPPSLTARFERSLPITFQAAPRRPHTRPPGGKPVYPWRLGRGHGPGAASARRPRAMSWGCWRGRVFWGGRFPDRRRRALAAGAGQGAGLVAARAGQDAGGPVAAGARRGRARHVRLVFLLRSALAPVLTP